MLFRFFKLLKLDQLSSKHLKKFSAEELGVQQTTELDFFCFFHVQQRVAFPKLLRRSLPQKE